MCPSFMQSFRHILEENHNGFINDGLTDGQGQCRIEKERVLFLKTRD